jgi:hypothetical protein
MNLSVLAWSVPPWLADHERAPTRPTVPLYGGASLRCHQPQVAGIAGVVGLAAEGCRHLIVDWLDTTGARRGLQGAEAILKLRALVSSGDFDSCWRTTCPRDTDASFRPATSIHSPSPTWSAGPRTGARPSPVGLPGPAWQNDGRAGCRGMSRRSVGLWAGEAKVHCAASRGWPRPSRDWPSYRHCQDRVTAVRLRTSRATPPE